MPAQVATQLRDQLVEEYQRESVTTQKVLKAIPSNKLDFKPHAKSMALGDLAWHLVSADAMFVSSLVNGKFEMGKNTSGFPKERPNSVDAIVSAHEKWTAKNVADLKSLSGDQLARELDFAGVAKLPAVAYMRWCISHDIHHRAQLSVYLRLVDAKVPSIYGPSADDNPFEKK
jgi:uncharacterized damage-inducible protein DinB